MPKFRKKPVVVDAIQWLAADDANALAIASMVMTTSVEVVRHVAWNTTDGRPQQLLFDYRGGMGVITPIIKTLEGDMVVSLGDWVILGVKRELYPCKPDIFEATYETEASSAPVPVFDGPDLERAREGLHEIESALDSMAFAPREGQRFHALRVCDGIQTVANAIGAVPPTEAAPETVRLIKEAIRYCEAGEGILDLQRAVDAYNETRKR